MTERLEPAPKAAVQTLARELEAKLAPLSRQRLIQLIALMDATGQINYAAAYTQLFPRSAQSQAEKTKADKAFNKFRTTLAAIAEEHGLEIELKVDQNRNADPADRRLWFAVADDATSRISDYNRGATASLDEIEHPQEQTLSVRDTELSYLLVYAKAEREEAHKLHDALATAFNTLGLKWNPLDYQRIPPGENPREIRQDYLRQSSFILFCLSKALIAELMENEEFRRDRPLIPLKMKAFQDQDLARTILKDLTPAADMENKAWSQRQSDRKDAWIDQVSRAIPARLERDLSRKVGIFAHLKAGALRPEDCDPEHFVDPYLKAHAKPEGQRALPFLLEWLTDPQGSALCALFGELGMGKTTLSQRLTRELMGRHELGEAYPFPVYLDLRHVNAMDWDWSRGAPQLDAILQHILESAYNQELDSPLPQVEDVKRLAQKQGGLVIFDGLDEVMNRLTPEQCHAFIQRLWNVLPPAVWKRGGERPQGCGRLLMTCRSHFFQTLRDQLGALSGRQREAVTEQDYLWVNLLPFNQEQVETYFRQVFSSDPQQAQRVIAMLDQLHDLRELSSRPYNLRLIHGQVEQLEAIQRQGGRVSIADLYEGMVGEWTRRDDPKHRLKREHKLLLMERLAHRLWRRQEQSLDYADLEDWLLDELAAEPRWQFNYQAYLQRENGIDILQEDLRNASFIVREGEQRFRFAHTSIMEFFLARALHRALLEGKPEQWALPRPSPETLDFLGGLIAARATQACLATLDRLRSQYREDASELTLFYALRAHEQGYPGARFDGFQLQGAQLREQRFGATAGGTLSWRGADLNGARLDGSRFLNIDLTDARFDQAGLSRCLFDGCTLERVSGLEADLTGTIFHHSPAPQADFSSSRLYRTQWLDAPAHPPPPGLDAPPPALFRAASAPAPEDAARVSATGHLSGINALAVDPAGKWIASGSNDGTIRLWNPRSGECLNTLEGNSDRVLSLAVDPAGAWLASGSHDGTLKLWDPHSGECLCALEGHSRAVRSLAVGPLGTWFASGSDDCTVRLWDPHSGAALRSLEGQSRGVSSLAVDPAGGWLSSASFDGTIWFSDPHSGVVLRSLEKQSRGVSSLAVDPAGTWLASGSVDGTIRLWDPRSGNSLRTLEGHSDWVRSLAVDPTGKWLASGSDDGSIRLWDPHSGTSLRVLEGHSGTVRSLAMDPAGEWLASGSLGGAVRLWDPRSGDPLRTLVGHSRALSSLAVDPAGKWLASSSHDRTIRLWDSSSRVSLRTLVGHSRGVWSLAVDPAGDWLASGSDDGTIKLWDPRSGNSLRTLEGHSGGVWSLSVDPAGEWLASCSYNDTVKLWDPWSGECLRTLAENSRKALSLVVDPGGEWLASGSSDGTVSLWDPRSGAFLRTLEGNSRWVRSLAVDPSGTWLASGTIDGTIRLWDPCSGASLHTLEGHSNWVLSLAVDPAGKWLASGSDDGIIRLWDPRSGACLRTLEGHSGAVSSLTVDPTGWLVATAGARVLFWQLRPKAQIAAGSRSHMEPPLEETPSLALENLPEHNWVSWRDPRSPRRRWLHHSRDAWRWLGWHAPAPDGDGWTLYPMDYFRE